jgi:hypothetical protein
MERLFGALDVVLFPESLYSSSRIDEFLLTGEKRMTGRTDLNMGEVNGRSRLDLAQVMTTGL